MRKSLAALVAAFVISAASPTYANSILLEELATFKRASYFVRAIDPSGSCLTDRGVIERAAELSLRRVFEIESGYTRGRFDDENPMLNIDILVVGNQMQTAGGLPFGCSSVVYITYKVWGQIRFRGEQRAAATTVYSEDLYTLSNRDDQSKQAAELVRDIFDALALDVLRERDRAN